MLIRVLALVIAISFAQSPMVAADRVSDCVASSGHALGGRQRKSAPCS